MEHVIYVCVSHGAQGRWCPGLGPICADFVIVRPHLPMSSSAKAFAGDDTLGECAATLKVSAYGAVPKA